MNIECDTAKLYDDGTKLSEQLNELQAELDKFFKKIEQIPITGEWTGKNAEAYCEKVFNDLTIYTDFIMNMHKIADEMRVLADSTDDTIKECQSLTHE